MGRIVLHVDMDAFYASVEELAQPGLVGKPVVIGANPRGGKGRGVVSTANYVARTFGIRSAMPISAAYRACPEAIFLAPSFPAYKSASRDVMEILGQYADILEVVGMDEAYLDVTDACGKDWLRVPSFCRSLQAAVKRQTGLSCSIGASAGKAIAKIASDYRKPHGVTVVEPRDQATFLAPLPVRLINGCGPKTVVALHDIGLEKIGELATADPAMMRDRFGKHGPWLQHIAQGKDDRPVRADRGPAKSRGNERTYGRDTNDSTRIQADAKGLLAGIMNRDSESRGFATITVKIRYSDFTTLTRAHTLSVPIQPGEQHALALGEATVESLLRPLLDGRNVRLVGVRVSNFSASCGQRSLAHFGVVPKAVVPVPS